MHKERRIMASSVNLMTEGNIKKIILSYALPIFIGNLFQQLYNTADALMVGNFVGETALAAVTSVGSLTYLLVGFFTGFSTGASVIIAREIGARNKENAHKAIHTAIALGLILSILMTLIGVNITPILLKMMGSPGNVYPLSVDYLTIYFYGSTFLVMYNIFVGILQAGGDAKHPLYYLITSSLINIILDYFLITTFDLGVKGAAIATIFSEFISMLLCLIRLIKDEGVLHINFLDIKFDKNYVIEIIKFGLPTGLQACVIDIANIMIQSYVNSFGSATIAGIGAYSKAEGFVFLPVTAFSLALTTFISQNRGAQQFDRANKGARFGLVAALIMIETIGVIMFVFAPVIISAFNRDPKVVEIGVQRARCNSLFYCLLGFSHVTSAIMRGHGKPVMPVVVMLVCWCAVRVTTLMTLGQIIHDIRLANWLYPITWGLSSIVYIIMLFKMNIFHKPNKLES